MPTARKTSLENVRVRPNDDLALNLRRKKGFGGSDVNGQMNPAAATVSKRYSYAGAGVAGIGVKTSSGQNGIDVVKEEEVPEDEESSGDRICQHLINILWISNSFICS